MIFSRRGGITLSALAGASLLALAACSFSGGKSASDGAAPSPPTTTGEHSPAGSSTKPSAASLSYSPYSQGDHSQAADDGSRPYYGDTHLHTSYSTDAGMIGNTLGPEDAYRFARGELVTSSTGLPVRLQRPLDFLVVSDHSENLGLSPGIAEGNPIIASNAWASRFSTWCGRACSITPSRPMTCGLKN